MRASKALSAECGGGEASAYALMGSGLTEGRSSERIDPGTGEIVAGAVVPVPAFRCRGFTESEPAPEFHAETRRGPRIGAACPDCSAMPPGVPFAVQPI